MLFNCFWVSFLVSRKWSAVICTAPWSPVLPPIVHEGLSTGTSSVFSVGVNTFKLDLSTNEKSAGLSPEGVGCSV